MAPDRVPPICPRSGVEGHRWTAYHQPVSNRSTPPVPTVRSGWLAGLQHKIARALLDEGFHSKEHARAAVMDGRISPALTPGLGHQSYLLLCEWLSVPPQMKEPSSAEVAAAVALLERAGYEVTLKERNLIVDMPAQVPRLPRGE